MKKLLIIGIIGAVALVAIAKKTNVCSYASTLYSSVSADVKGQVPTKFELERIRNEIASLDGDIGQMVRPIAEYKVVIEKMRRDITVSNDKITTQKADLLLVIKDLESGKKEHSYGGKVWTPDQVRRQLDKDTDALKRLERHVKAQQQMLEAKEQSLKATQEQLAKVITMKRDFEVELTRLEAEEESLQVAKIGSTVKIDSSRATLIKDALASVEHKQKVERETANLWNNEVVSIPLNDRTSSAPVDLQAVRSYLEGVAPADKTASNK